MSLVLQPVRFTIQEGGEWFPWFYLTLEQPIHAIMFEDGRIIDVLNGLRPNSLPNEGEDEEEEEEEESQWTGFPR